MTDGCRRVWPSGRRSAPSRWWPTRSTAYEELEAAVLGAGGGVVRFGQFYGPGTYYETELPDEPRIHIDTAARRAFEAMDAEGIVLATD
jgi:hypothetical protein